jgi:hypothetical protein
MITLLLPVATRVQAANPSPTLAAARPLMFTVALPPMMGAVWPPHLLPAGLRCGEEKSPRRAAPRPLITTLLLADAMT